jgi:hypothetical protein
VLLEKDEVSTTEATITQQPKACSVVTDAAANMSQATHSIPQTDEVIPFNALSVADVCQLLNGIGLSMYKDAFESNLVDGRALVECTNESDLKDAGIEKAFHARKLISYLNEWKSSATPGVPKNLIQT